MNTEIQRGELCWLFLNRMLRLTDDHHGHKTDMAARGLEALRANGDFYDWYGGSYDLLQAAAVFRAFAWPVDLVVSEARACLASAGWTRSRVDTVEFMLRALADRKAPYRFRGHEAAGRSYTGGLFVLRDVEVVPLVLPDTMEDCQIAFQDAHGLSKAKGGLELHKVFMSLYMNLYAFGDDSLGWSCAYSAALTEHPDKSLLITKARKCAVKNDLCDVVYADDDGMAHAATEAARRHKTEFDLGI